MRYHWIAVVALLVVSGCASTGGNPSKSGDVFGAAPPAQPATWTSRLTSPFMPAHAQAPARSKSAQALRANDAIALQFKSGPPSAELYVSMAQLSDQGGNTDHARAMYNKALAAEPKNLTALLGLARMEDRLGNLEVALQNYYQATRLYPQEARAWNDLGLCLARTEQLQKSLEALNQAVRMRPDRELYRNNIAKVWVEQNRLDLALAHLQAVYEPPTANYNMAAILSERDRTPEAIGYLNTALALNPQMTQAQNLLASLNSSQASAEQVAAGQPVRSPQAANAQVASEQVLPTPVFSGEDGLRFPSTGVPPVVPQPTNGPPHTARAPGQSSSVGFSPVM